MLAKTFLPAQALGLTEDEKEAAILFAGMAERGEIPEDEFSMSTAHPDAGGGGCITFWIEKLAGAEIGSLTTRVLFEDDHPASALFFPPGPLHHVTAAQAGRATFEWLETGNPKLDAAA